jgi:hypothetical protein
VGARQALDQKCDPHAHLPGPQQVEARRAYLDADVMSILRKDFNVDWKKTHMSALEALEALIKVIKSNETMSIEMVLANESNKQWWPFAFVTAGNKSD